jgi:hypothetical protein
VPEHKVPDQQDDEYGLHDAGRSKSHGTNAIVQENEMVVRFDLRVVVVEQKRV